jgi:iron complex transport system substrate-binding protein
VRRAALAGFACTAFFVHAETTVVKDDQGVSLRFERAATRIVTLAPSLTELAFTAGAGGSVVGVSAFSDDPPVATARKVVADSAGVNLEALLALKPDLVIAWKSGNKSADIERIRGLKIPVYVAEIARLRDVPRVLRDIGAMARSEQIADLAATVFEDEIAALKTTYASKRKVRVFFEISRQPLMSINGQHAIDEIITLCGGENILKDAPVLVPQISVETLFAKEPAAIIYAADKDGANAAPWERYRGLSAQKRGHIFRVSPNPVLRAGSRMVEGAREVCSAIEAARR